MSTIRPATAADAAAIARIHVDTWRASYYGILPDTYLSRLSRRDLRRKWATRLASESGSEAILVAQHGRGVAGFAVVSACGDRDMEGFAGEVTMLYVHPTRAGAGHGTALMDRCAALLEAHEFRWLVVWVVEDNIAARGFYRHLGMRNDGETRLDRFDGQPIRVVRYAAPINPVIDFDQLGRVTAR